MSHIVVPSEDKASFAPFRSVTAAGVTYRFDHQIGVGAFSKVFRGVDSWGNKVVAKVLSPDADPRLWEREVVALHRFRHPSVVHLLSSFTHRDHRFLVLEDAGVCVARLKHAVTKRERATLSIARGLLHALQFVHDRGYIHGDVCPNNVLAPNPKSDEATAVKLADFAFCRSLKSLAKGPQMFAPWQHAPENLGSAESGTLGTATDVYLAALVLYRIASGDVHRYSEDETLRGEPIARARALGTAIGEALATALESDASRRPSALGLWLRLREAFRPAP